MAGIKVYTKTGDAGQTSLVGGRRVPKNHERIMVYGTVDEINVNVGALRDKLDNHNIIDVLIKIQNDLFVLGSLLAYDGSKEVKLPNLTSKNIDFLEEQIDILDIELPQLRNFILPGGHPAVSQCHMCRVVCRRAERLLVGLMENTEVDLTYVKYLNRLSDYFFVLSRSLAQYFNAPETPWIPDKH